MLVLKFHPGDAEGEPGSLRATRQGKVVQRDGHDAVLVVAVVCCRVGKEIFFKTQQEKGRGMGAPSKREGARG